MNDIDPQSSIFALFLSDCEQLLQQAEKLLLQSDQTGVPEDPAELFRILHTLKGSSAMMEFTPLVEITHAFEDILSAVKSQPVTEAQVHAIADAGLEYTAYFGEELARISGGAAPQGNERLSAQIRALASSLGLQARAEAPAAVAIGAHAAGDGRLWAQVKLRQCPLPHIRASIIARAASALCTNLVTNPENPAKSPQYAAAILANGFEIGFLPKSAVTADEVIAKLGAQPFVLSCRLQAPAAKPQDGALPQLQTITISQSLVNTLIAAMGEVIAADAALEVCARETGCNTGVMRERITLLRRTVNAANLIASQIGTHMVGSVFLQMQRAIRTIAREQGKEIKVELIGSDVQVDKSILDLLSDALIHMVRNATDHGIELPEVRESLGKPRAGCITLTASKKNDFLTVIVSDDGAGINRRAVLDKAERGGKLGKPKHQYTDRDVANLLLFTGVSTSDTVTQYSGRGVGLVAAVRRVRQAGGRVTLESSEGRGTSFTLRIPISLLQFYGVAVTLMDGNEMIVPANAIRHIAMTDCAPSHFRYKDHTYTHILFPGQAAHADDGDGYTILFDRDFGRYYIRAKSVKMIAIYYLKKMPEFISDVMGHMDIYAGCVMRSTAKLCCVLDVVKLIGLSEASE